MESSGINVKTFLEQQAGQHNSSNAEIRRFVLDQEVSANYDYLVSKIAAIYPCLAEHNFRVYWKDEENDMVAISSDEELIQAMCYGRPSGLLKLYLVNTAPSDPFTTRPASAGTGSSPNVEHPGVVCDGCDTGIRGLRFKCLVCADYDLCSTCCDKGLHNHHYMLRLANPATEWQGCGRRGGRHGGAGTWWWPGSQQGWNGPQAMRRFWRNMMRNQAAQDGAQQEGPTCTAEGAPAGAPAGAATNDTPNGTANDTEEQREYLQHVGEQVSAMLEPLGVSVDVAVEERPGKQRGDRQGRGQCKGQGRRLGGKGRQCGREGRCKPSEDCKQRNKCCRRGCAPDEECLRREKCSSDGHDTQGATDSQGVCDNQGACKPAPDCTTGGACSMDTAEVASAEQLKTSNASSASVEKSGASNVDQSELSEEAPEEPRADDQDMDSGEDNSWVRIEPKPTDTTTSSTSEPTVVPAMKLYPSISSVPEPSASFSVPDPASPSLEASAPPPSKNTVLNAKVAEAVEQMRAMGFHDDGGWMTAMLFEHDADVSKVIDSVLRTAHTSRRD